MNFTNLRTPLLASAAALALLLGGAGIAGAAEMKHGQGMQMHEGQGEHHGGKGRQNAGGDDDEGACPQASMMGEGKMAGRMMGAGKDMHGGKGEMARAHMSFPSLPSADDVRARFERMIAGNKRLKVAMVEPGGDFSFRVDITTLDGSLVHKLLVDRRDGRAWELD